MSSRRVALCSSLCRRRRGCRATRCRLRMRHTRLSTLRRWAGRQHWRRRSRLSVRLAARPSLQEETLPPACLPRRPSGRGCRLTRHAWRLVLHLLFRRQW